jgi:transposase
MVAWADAYQRQTRRLQQHVALQAASAPVQHVAAQYGLDWSTVRRAEQCALTRWLDTRTKAILRQVGVDEKYLGRRRRGIERFVTIVSNNETGEPIWIGFGRSEETLGKWIKTLTKQEKAGICLFVSDMHQAFENAIRADPELNHAVLVHDVFHVMKRAGEAMDELRRDIFFRAGAHMRALGKGKRWLLLRAWERTTETQRAELKQLFSYNGTLARFYQVVEELRLALHAPTRETMGLAFTRMLLRTQRRTHQAIRSFHDSLIRHAPNLYALADHRPATGRVEALNNNWETLVRRGRGYRDLPYLLLKLRFATVNPVYTEEGTRRFLALGLSPPLRQAHA